MSLGPISIELVCFIFYDSRLLHIYTVVVLCLYRCLDIFILYYVVPWDNKMEHFLKNRCVIESRGFGYRIVINVHIAVHCAICNMKTAYIICWHTYLEHNSWKFHFSFFECNLDVLLIGCDFSYILSHRYLIFISYFIFFFHWPSVLQMCCFAHCIACCLCFLYRNSFFQGILPLKLAPVSLLHIVVV